jgi:hypothetical protein
MQFGSSSPRAVLVDVSPATERMVAALAQGISPSGLVMIARAAGSTAEHAQAVMTALAPVLRDEDALDHPPTTLVLGVGRVAERIVEQLSDVGVPVLVAPGLEAAATATSALAVIVSDYVIDPETMGFWLRRDVPHLPVIVGDDIEIGPVIEPGSGPCLYCLYRHQADADASWTAIATQLLHRRGARVSELRASEAASAATRRLLARAADGPAPAAETVILDGATGERTVRVREPHPECGCADAAMLGGPRARRGSGSPIGAHHDRSPAPTRSATAGSVPA